MVEIISVTQVTAEVVEAFQRLFPQLSPAPPPGPTELEAIVASQSSTIYVARDFAQQGRIVGTLTLVIYRVPNGLHAWIEDVIVDAPMRRQGIGQALIGFAIARASELGAKAVDLTSRPVRQDANRLYQKLGFEQRQTNQYRYFLNKER